MRGQKYVFGAAPQIFLKTARLFQRIGVEERGSVVGAISCFKLPPKPAPPFRKDGGFFCARMATARSLAIRSG
jgi:hypothetical protein